MTDFTDPIQSSQSSVACFDANEVYENNMPVYLNVNLHIFTDNSCLGGVQQMSNNQEQAYAIAEGIINNANQLMTTNPQQWPFQTPPVIVQSPVRYVLKGVYMHCRSGVTLGQFSTLHQIYGINKSTEFNYYVTGNEPSAGWVGIAPFKGTYGAINNEYYSTFNHEIGHNLNLVHVNGHSGPFDDGCPDTNPKTHTWDKNCDGVITYSEEFRLCWDLATGSTDDNNNGVPDCEEVAPCTPTPCCSWEYQNNNLMLSAGLYAEALSECQVLRMLNELADNKCNYIAQIDGERPPNAFITQTPKDLANTTFCSETLILGASFNDASHFLEIYKINGTSQNLVYSTGWVNQPAQNLTFGTVSGYGLTLAPLTMHKVILKVRNVAGAEHTAEYTFTTPNANCELDPDPPIDSQLAVSPNPGNNNNVQIEFPSSTGKTHDLWAVNQVTGASAQLLNGYPASDGSNTVSVNVSTLGSGTYSFNLSDNNNHVFHTLFIKF